jgi:hypothetical protein
MKKKALVTALMAGITGAVGIVGVSNAINVNPDGTGQVLLYPYYTTRLENDTLISVVNTTDQVKAVKVRFLEGENSREVLDFNLYMSPFDVWTGSITEGVGGPVFRTADNSCTVPYFFAGSGELPFVDFLFNDSGSTGIDRAREGYVELIEMGEVGGALGAAAIHGSDGEPADCNTLVAAWSTGGIWTQDPTVDLTPPAGGLFGDGVIINVPGARAMGFDAVALDGFSTIIQHRTPSTPEPRLDDVTPAVSYSVLSTGGSPVLVSDDWTLQEPVQAVTAVLMADQIHNQYATEAIIGGSTEWVVTHPTKAQHVNGAAPIEPFTQLFANGFACEPIVLEFWDRNEAQSPLGPILPSPPPPSGGPSSLCFEANVVTFNDSLATEYGGGIVSDILGSRLSVNFDVDGAAGFDTGWAQLRFNDLGSGVSHSMTNTTSGRVYQGLPVVGFGARTADNVSLNALFGVITSHKYTRAIQ